MKGRALAVLGVGVVGAVLVACGGSSGPSSTPTPTPQAIKFVGNESCPTASASPYAPMPPGVNGDKAIGQAIDEMPHTHIQSPAKVQYNHNPPTSGCHYSQGQPNPAPIAPGVYNQVIPAEYWVHNLEHGYVAVLYNCPTGCQDDVNKLVAWKKQLPPDPGKSVPYAKIIVMPWPTMDKKFAAVSWDYYIGWDSLNIDDVQAFYDNHVNRSPEGAMAG